MCNHHLDPDGEPCYPYYGLAPHDHADHSAIAPKEQWPSNFEEATDDPGMGVYHCPECISMSDEYVS